MVPSKKPIVVCLPVSLLLVFSLIFTGCAIVAPIAVTSTTMGVAYYYMNVTEKTCVYDIDTMHKASLLTLKRMGFQPGEQFKDEDGNRKILAETNELGITVKLKKVTDKCTKMKVSVRKSIVIRDKATAAEIIMQTERTAELMKYSNGRHAVQREQHPPQAQQASWSLLSIFGLAKE